jgi:drug/metabolite transporter (DMT)-like permease
MAMSIEIILLVLFAAAMHAGWNALIKVNSDRVTAMAYVTLFGSLVSAPVLLFLPFPAEEAWGLLALTIILHTAYHLFLPAAYKYGDLGQVYPIARGVAPVLVLGIAYVIADESVSLPVVIGVLCLVAGVVSLSYDHKGGGLPHRRAVGFAILTGTAIASFTVADGLGARLSGNALSFAAWTTFLDGILTYLLIWAYRGKSLPAQWRTNFIPLFVGGVMQVGTYWIIVFALTLAPLAMVSALRETSVLFAALLSTFLLKEGLHAWRFVSAALVAAGLMIMRGAK